MKFGPLDYIVLDNLGAGQMKDDSLNDTQREECSCGRYHTASEFTCHKCGKLVPVKRPSGYCPKCDTVYDEPHECVGTKLKCDCDIGMCTHRTNCRNNPLKIAQDKMNKVVKNYGRLDFESKLICEIWNEAIEAAALKCIALSEQDDWSPGYKRSAQVIASKLKELRK